MIKPNTKEWFDNKLKYIGANDVACLLNEGYYSKNELINNKIYLKEKLFDKATEIRMKRGLTYEPLVKLEFEKRHNIKLLEMGQKRHKKYKFLFATPDSKIPNGALVEFKVRSKINKSKIDYKYFIQCQIQMEVFDLDECILCENIIIDDKVIDYIERSIKRDINWFNSIINEIREIYDDINKQRRLKIKRIKLVDEIKKYSSSMLNNYINNEPLLDYFEKYHSELKVEDTKFFDFICEKMDLFRSKFYELIKTNINKDKYLDISEFNNKELNKELNNYDFKYNIDYELAVIKTEEAIQKRIPIIMNGVLEMPYKNVILYNKYNLIINVKYLNNLMKIPDEFLDIEEKSYIPINLYYSKINLCVDKMRLLQSKKQKKYIMNIIFGGKILNHVQKKYGLNKIKKGLIIGRKTQYKNKLQLSCFGKLGYVEYDNDDLILKRIYKGLDWLLKLNNGEIDWTLETIPIKYLPNMNNEYDYGWRNLKTKIAIERKELTLVNGLSYEMRLKLHKIGIHDYDEYYKMNPNESISNENIINNLNTVIQHKSDYIYLDFEYLNDFNDDMTDFPYVKDETYLYLIGIIYKNKYQYFLMDKFTREDELLNFNKLLDFIETNKIKHLLHWGNFEEIQYKNLLKKYDIMPNRAVKFIDICGIVKAVWSSYDLIKYEIFGYSIKSIAAGLYKKGLIKNKWALDIIGQDTMILIWNEYNKNKNINISEYKNMNNIINYNKSDCIILQEIIFIILKKCIGN